MKRTEPTRARRQLVTMLAAFVLVPAVLAIQVGSADAVTSSPSGGGTYTVYVAPTKVNAGSTSWFGMGVVDNGPGRMGSFRVALPPGFVPRLPFGAALTPEGSWSLSLQTCAGASPAPCAGAGSQVIEADARHSDGSDSLRSGEGLVFLFQATAATRGGVYPWQSAATSGPSNSGTAFTPPTSATTPTITVLSNAATALVISGLPASVTAGDLLSPTVTAIDAFGNPATGYRGTVHFTLGGSAQLQAAAALTTSGASTPGDYTFTAGDAGQHTFRDGLVLTNAPQQDFSVTDQSNQLTTGTVTVPITPASASQLALSVPTSTSAGAQQSWGVTAYDPYGNVATGYTGTVHFAVTGDTTDEDLPADYAFGDSDGGTASVNATLVHSGARTVSITDGTLADHAATNVSAASAQTLTVTPTQTTVTAGDTFDATVTITDHYGNLVPDYTGTVAFATIPGASLPPGHTFVPSDGGSFTFTGLSLTRSGTVSLQAGDGELVGTAAMNVNPGAATQLTVESAPSAVTAGVAFGIDVAARDAYGNIDTSVNTTGSLDCGTALGAGSCPAPGFADGTTTALPELDVAGPGHVVVHLGELSTQVDVTVDHNDAATLVVTTAPTPTITAGDTFGLTATVYDGYGNKIGEDAGRPVTLSALPTNAAFPVTAHTSGGVVTFSGIQVNTAANYLLTVSSDGLRSAPASIDVTAAPAVGLRVLAPGSVTAGSTFTATASVIDGYGNVVGTDNGTTVSLVSYPTANGLPTSAVTTNGVATFSGVALSTATSTTLSATTGALTGTTSVSVTAGAPASLTILSLLDQGSVPRLNHPVVNQPFDTTVGFLDSQGNPADASGATVTLTRTTGTGVLGGTTSAIVPSGASQVAIVGSTYSVLENGVVLTASATGLAPTPTPASLKTDVAGQAATTLTAPGTSTTLNSLDPYLGTPCVLSATQGTCSQYILPNGGTSAVFLYQTVCANSTDTPGLTCKTSGSLIAQLVYALGQLQDTTGHPLYSATHPATLVVGCYKTLCVHPDKEGATEKWTATELAEDVKANPLRVTVSLDGIPGAPATFTGDATVCSKPGVVNAGKYFCLDPKLTKRDANGNYIQYLLFYGDPKAINR